MADYHTPTVVQQTIPNYAIPLERLLLTNIFDADESIGEHYFYAEESPQTMLALGRDELDAAIAASQEHPSSALPAIQEQLSRCEPDQSTIYLDLSGVLLGDNTSRRRSPFQYAQVHFGHLVLHLLQDAVGRVWGNGGRYHRHKHSREINGGYPRRTARGRRSRSLRPDLEREGRPGQCLISHHPPPHGSPIRCAGGAIDCPRLSNGSNAPSNMAPAASPPTPPNTLCSTAVSTPAGTPSILDIQETLAEAGKSLPIIPLSLI